MRSASNYLLGLSPLRFAPYITGTLAGMAIWSTVYATLGSASRALLQSGVEPDVLLAGARAVWQCCNAYYCSQFATAATVLSHAWLFAFHIILVVKPVAGTLSGRRDTV